MVSLNKQCRFSEMTLKDYSLLTHRLTSRDSATISASSIAALFNMLETLQSHVLSGWNLPFANRRQERTPVIATDDAAVHASESTNHS